MKNWKNIKLLINDNQAQLFLNRPEKHNALNPELIEEMHQALDQLKLMDDINFVVLTGKGASFCSGADINWFAQGIFKGKSENWEEYLRMAELLKKLYELPQITIAAAHKNVLGGANGFLAACDFAVAEQSTSFAFGEVKLGIVPATIMPFIARRVSSQNMKKLFYSGDAFWSREAQLIGLIDFLAEDGKLIQTVNKLIEDLNRVSPNALKSCKQLVQKTISGEVNVSTIEYTSGILADLVHSPEGQEGLRAFLEKRKPNWSVVKVEDN